MENMTYFVALMLCLFGCSTTNNHMQPNHNPTDSIEAVIEEARIRISKHLKNNGIDPKGKNMIFEAYGQIRTENNDNHCEIFHNQGGYDEINEKVIIGSNWVVAMILDKKGNYIASSSSHTLNKNPEALNSYTHELKMIELAKKNNYVTFIKLLNCYNYIIGYKKGEVDVYRYTDNEMYLVYTK